MAEDLQTFSPNNVFAGEDQILTVRATLKASQGAIAAYTPLKYDSTSSYQLVPATALADASAVAGLLAPTSGVGQTATGVADSASTQEVIIYTAGAFYKSILSAATFLTSKEEANYFFSRGSNIRIVETKTGQD